MKSRPHLYQLGLRFPKATLLLCLALTVLAFAGVRKLHVESDLLALLPQDFESVKALNGMREYFGGIGFVVVAVEGNDSQQTERFTDRFVERIEQLPQVQFVDYRRPVDFFSARQWLYIDLDDLQEMERRLDRSLLLQEKGFNPLFNKFIDFADKEDRPDLTYKDILKKYRNSQSTTTERVAVTDEGRLISFKIKTKSHQHNIDQSHALMEQLDAIENELLSQAGMVGISVFYTGNTVTTMEGIDRLKVRMTTVAIGVALLLILVLVAYFRTLNVILLIGLPLAIGVLWTGGLVYVLMGHLNILTGFAAGILAGLGSDYGIYLVKRFNQERSTGSSFETACERAFRHTGRATFFSMITTVFAFLALVLSDFGVTIEFGIVGAIGLSVNYLAMMLIIPSIIVLQEKWRPQKSAATLKTSANRWVTILFAPKAPLLITIAVLLLCAASVLTLPEQSVISFEDGRLDIAPRESTEESEKQDQLYHKVRMLHGGNLQPTLLITKGKAEDKRTIRAFNNELTKDKNGKLPFREIIGISSFVPDKQFEKQQLLVRMAEKFEGSRFPVRQKRAELIRSIQQSSNARHISQSDLPIEITRLFTSPTHEDIFAVFLFPEFEHLTWDWMQDYSNTVNRIRSEHQLNFMAVDNPFIATEFVKMIQDEAPRMIMLIFAILLVILLWIIRPVKYAFVIYAHLIGALLLLQAVMWLFNIPLNTINIAALPIVLGTGIDCFIHFTLRFEETGNITTSIQEKLPSVLVSNLTTMIGFGGLLFVPSAGLRTLGWTTLLGLAIMTLLCTFVLPRVLLLMTRKRKQENTGFAPT